MHTAFETITSLWRRTVQHRILRKPVSLFTVTGNFWFLLNPQLP